MSFQSSAFASKSYRRRALVASVLLSSLLPAHAGADAFEQAPALNAAQVLGAANTTSNLFTLDAKVQNDGLYNRFAIRSSFFNADPVGNDLAKERVLEVKAVDAMSKIKGSDAYVQGLENAVSGVLAASKEVITNPVQTISDLPSNVSRVIGDVFTAIGNIGKSDNGSDDALKNLIGYNKAKRYLADSLDVDPYSSNPVLQESLDDLAWVTFAGNATLDIPLAVSGAGTAVTGIGIAAGVQDPLRDVGPTSLININTQMLEQMGIKDDEKDRFLFNKVLNIRHQTFIVHALHSLTGVSGRDNFVRMATKTSNEHQARVYQTTAILIAAYHRDVSPVKRIEIRGATAFITDARGTVVLPLAADHVAWTAKTAKHFVSFPAGGKRAMWTNGTVSTGLRSHLDAKGITVEAEAFKRISPSVKITLTLK